MRNMRLGVIAKRIHGFSLNDAFSPVKRIAMRPVTACPRTGWVWKLKIRGFAAWYQNGVRIVQRYSK
jgi:hypothetical protein